MSKQIRVFYLTIAAVGAVLQFFTNTSAQDITATIKVDKKLPHVVEINGRFSDGSSLKRSRNLSFLLDYAGVRDLGGRIGEVRLFDASGTIVANRRMIDGEYLAEGDYASWAYTIAVEPKSRPSALAHVSWKNRENGILMLGDLLPQFGDAKVSARIEVDAGSNRQVFSSASEIATNTFVTSDVSRAVFFIGNWRTVETGVRSLNLAISGERHFSDEEAAQMAKEIFGEYKKLFNSEPNAKMQIAIGTLPAGQSGQWYAETRGTTVTIMSSDMAFGTQSLQRLHEQLRHEIFHLWLPNAVNLKGNYDWFYEGFALYASLKSGVRLNRIRFEDFLDTLSRAHRFDDAIPPKESLVDASENRWGGGNGRVYARGMLVAFLCDIAILQKSKGKRSVEDLIGQLYADHREPAEAADANVEVLRLLRSKTELVPLIDKYITGKERIAWSDDLRAAGLEASASVLSVVPKPSGGQRALLDKLGYNNWRKLSRDPK